VSQSAQVVAAIAAFHQHVIAVACSERVFSNVSIYSVLLLTSEIFLNSIVDRYLALPQRLLLLYRKYCKEQPNGERYSTMVVSLIDLNSTANQIFVDLKMSDRY
jgi:hypothetical protein